VAPIRCSGMSPRVEARARRHSEPGAVPIRRHRARGIRVLADPRAFPARHTSCLRTCPGQQSPDRRVGATRTIPWGRHTALRQRTCQGLPRGDTCVPQAVDLQQQPVCRPLRRLTARGSRCAAIRANGPPVALSPPKDSPAHPRRRQRRARALAEQFPLLLRHRRIDPHHQIVGARHALKVRRRERYGRAAHGPPLSVAVRLVPPGTVPRCQAARERRASRSPAKPVSGMPIVLGSNRSLILFRSQRSDQATLR
jgi:hypothetical protein